MTANTRGPELTQEQLRRILGGQQHADVAMRRKAAITLGRSGMATAQPALVAALAVESDPQVRAGIAKALSWIGDADAYGPLMAAGATFAARLIAHREGLAAPDLPPLDLAPALHAPDLRTARPIDHAVPRPEAVRQCLRTIAGRSFRLTFDDDGLHALRCAQHEWMLVPVRDVVHNARMLLTRRATPFALAVFIPEMDLYAISHVALTTPPASLVLCRTTGEPAFAGAFQVSDGGVRIALAALAYPGACPIDVAARLHDGVLSFDRATYGPPAVPRLVPVPLDPRSLRLKR